MKTNNIELNMFGFFCHISVLNTETIHLYSEVVFVLHCHRPAFRAGVPLWTTKAGENTDSELANEEFGIKLELHMTLFAAYYSEGFSTLCIISDFRVLNRVAWKRFVKELKRLKRE